MVWAPEAVAGTGRRGGPEADDGPPAHVSIADVAGLTSLEVLRLMRSGPRGLVEAQAEERLLRCGENTVAARTPASWTRRLARSLRDPFTMVLLCLGLVSAAIASWATACVIVLLVVVSCVLRSGGEYRADRSIAALRELVATTATVRRRASETAASLSREIPVDQLVPGDVIRLGPGDLVPADVLLLRSSGLTVHQAALTGESRPVAKHAVDTPAAMPGTATTNLFDQPHLCFQGSGVASGGGFAVVVATGANTRFAGAHQEGAREGRPSSFDRSVNGISWLLIRFMLLIPPVVLVADAAVRGRGLATLPFAVAVAVGLTPEMLPVIVTTALARGSALLARSHGMIVRRLAALHDLGAVDVLCTDKTGTLTQDLPVLDCSVGPDGRHDPDVLRWAAVNSLWTLQLADLPNPDALDEAILDAAEELGDDLPASEGVAALPFDPVRRSSCAVVRHPDRTAVHTLVAKGAVEDVLDRCTLVRAGGADEELDAATEERLRRFAEEQAAAGLRLLAVALADRPARPGSYGPDDERDLTFLGFVGLRDTLAPQAGEALAVLARRGVAVKVLTGDHPGTAARVCRDLGLDPGTVVTADRIDGLTDAAVAELATRSTVFARCTPEHKARIVTALRAAGSTTGFLGDGVNDLPALRAADVGMCPSDAVDVTRQTADVVLAAKDLTAIDHAIMAGRRSTGNIVTYLRVVLSSNLGNVIAMLAAGLTLPFLPMLPTQVLLQNLCFDAAQLAYAFDRPDRAALRRPSRLRPRGLLRFIAVFGPLNALADLTTFAVLASAVPWSGQVAGQAAFHTGWFVENLLTQAVAMLLLRGRRHVPLPLGIAACFLVTVGLLLPLSPLAPLLGMTALPSAYYLLLAVVVVVYGAVLLAAKAWFERRHADRA
ncbi:magnesium-translocating P-type ATPase [Microtetraspora sp. NBRC 16547]|uniref:magnesium-translocating P-type ATPase n=1 Tax=Microtetraspora sp. NBRC 16547 TaxID=3030993 RepID=UPI0024A1DC19|nr:magnesium-translocating P-type ATPase [Microtetraspora sp. NBRC 16547]GLW97670.1 magnesium-translocating P-type ATPase [Microtetraspora sp. NBRC 16547]